MTITLALLPVATPAQEALPRLPDILDTVQDTEVYLLGYVGSGASGTNFGLGGGHEGNFPVLFEGDADLAAQVKGCPYELPCKVAAYGYLKWHGPVLQIIVTSFEAIGPSEVKQP